LPEEPQKWEGSRAAAQRPRHQEFIKTLDLPQSILEKIYHGNAERLLTEYK
jgi:hypothetical protein